ncbi:HAMP domain-containing histidine kinase, partial [Anaerolineae bacterium CFX9]|nr:HAMP domain-containing histidine kinase [Anaerolineae bacterium CFX9]
VSDTGIGIAPEDLPHIFQPFYRVVSEVEGTGLGLSIAREIAESHGGSIEVESHIGKGSCFSLILPISVSFVTPSTSGN